VVESERPERRREARHEVAAVARVRHGAKEVTLDVINVSRSGMLINLARARRPEWLEIDAQLSIGISAGKSALIEVTGKIARIVEDRRFRAFAVEFGELSPRARAGIEQMVTEATKKAAPPPLPKT
jgi:hypothetical protein